MSTETTKLQKTLGKNIDELCPFSIGKLSNQNHCAHYVSHMMDFEFSGTTCKNFTWADKQKPEKGATIRVNDVFKNCKTNGLLSSKSASITECLIFVTIASNMSTMGSKLTMGNNPRKHIGILKDGKIWNYSNTGNKVVSDLTSTFISKFTRAYKTSGTTVEFYYGTIK